MNCQQTKIKTCRHRVPLDQGWPADVIPRAIFLSQLKQKVISIVFTCRKPVVLQKKGLKLDKEPWIGHYLH